jgi:cytochrome c oxidase subunit 3
MGFQQLKAAGIDLLGIRSNTAASFLFVITGMHILHVLGGVVALLIIFLRAYRTSVKQYSPVGLEIAATYWHFVDILWIYLFIFYSWIG